MARFQSVDAKKGDVISLSKMSNDERFNLNQLHVGLGWDVHGSIQADLDAFVVQLDDKDKVIDLIYFNHLRSNDKAIRHTGDNLTGEGEGDDEVIYIDLDKMHPATHKLVVAVNIYQCRLTFNDVENAFIRVLDRKTNELLVRYDLSYEFGQNYSMIAGEIFKNVDGTWDFKAVGQPTPDRNITEVQRRVSTGKRTEQDPPRQDPPAPKRGWFSRLFG